MWDRYSVFVVGDPISDWRPNSIITALGAARKGGSSCWRDILGQGREDSGCSVRARS